MNQAGQLNAARRWIIHVWHHPPSIQV